MGVAVEIILFICALTNSVYSIDRTYNIAQADLLNQNLPIWSPEGYNPYLSHEYWDVNREDVLEDGYLPRGQENPCGACKRDFFDRPDEHQNGHELRDSYKIREMSNQRFNSLNDPEYLTSNSNHKAEIIEELVKPLPDQLEWKYAPKFYSDDTFKDIKSRPQFDSLGSSQPLFKNIPEEKKMSFEFIPSIDWSNIKKNANFDSGYNEAHLTSTSELRRGDGNPLFSTELYDSFKLNDYEEYLHRLQNNDSRLKKLDASTFVNSIQDHYYDKVNDTTQDILQGAKYRIKETNLVPNIFDNTQIKYSNLNSDKIDDINDKAPLRHSLTSSANAVENRLRTSNIKRIFDKVQRRDEINQAIKRNSLLGPKTMDYHQNQIKSKSFARHSNDADISPLDYPLNNLYNENLFRNMKGYQNLYFNEDNTQKLRSNKGDISDLNNRSLEETQYALRQPDPSKSSFIRELGDNQSNKENFSQQNNRCSSKDATMRDSKIPPKEGSKTNLENVGETVFNNYFIAPISKTTQSYQSSQIPFRYDESQKLKMNVPNSIYIGNNQGIDIGTIQHNSKTQSLESNKFDDVKSYHGNKSTFKSRNITKNFENDSSSWNYEDKEFNSFQNTYTPMLRYQNDHVFSTIPQNYGVVSSQVDPSQNYQPFNSTINPKMMDLEKQKILDPSPISYTTSQDCKQVSPNFYTLLDQNSKYNTFNSFPNQVSSNTPNYERNNVQLLNENISTSNYFIKATDINNGFKYYTLPSSSISGSIVQPNDIRMVPYTTPVNISPVPIQPTIIKSPTSVQPINLNTQKITPIPHYASVQLPQDAIHYHSYTPKVTLLSPYANSYQAETPVSHIQTLPSMYYLPTSSQHTPVVQTSTTLQDSSTITPNQKSCNVDSQTVNLSSGDKYTKLLSSSLNNIASVIVTNLLSNTKPDFSSEKANQEALLQVTLPSMFSANSSVCSDIPAFELLHPCIESPRSLPETSVKSSTSIKTAPKISKPSSYISSITINVLPPVQQKSSDIVIVV